MEGNRRLKELARELAVNAGDLLVLAPNNDPFNAGTPASQKRGEWFAGVWTEFGFGSGVHLRRVHYVLVSRAMVRKPDGTMYENTEGDWAFLCEAAKAARYLEFVDAKAFVDRRNPEPRLFHAPAGLGNVDWGCSGFAPWILPNLEVGMNLQPCWPLPTFEITNFPSADELQRYHIEIWCEKSTVDDVLLPLCRKYRVDLVTGLGFMSITSVLDLLGRIAQVGRATRILYISDFDPAGAVMPIAVARQIEFWLQESGTDIDIKLRPLVLTRKQVEEFRLPRTPVKDGDKRKGNFEERHGEGAVELDALEALHSGALKEITEEAIREFRDDTLAERVDEAREEFSRGLDEEWERRIGPYEAEKQSLEREVGRAVEPIRAKLAGIRAELEGILKPYRERMQALWLAVNQGIQQIRTPVPYVPEAEEATEGGRWLFDSSRSYVEQVSHYRRWQEGNVT